jgi:hypothetical protein
MRGLWPTWDPVRKVKGSRVGRVFKGGLSHHCHADKSVHAVGDPQETPCHDAAAATPNAGHAVLSSTVLTASISSCPVKGLASVCDAPRCLAMSR